MSCVHFVGGEKGGVGKSVLARLLCQWFVDHSAKLAALDADLAQGALMSGYAGWCQAVDLSVFESADQIMDRALGAARDVVVDLPARSHDQLSRWLRESDVAAMAEEMGVRLVFWLVTDGSFASAATLEKTLPELAASAEVIIVRNHCWTRDFSELESSDLRRQIEQRGCRILDLPLLDPEVMSKWGGPRDGLAFSESPNAESRLSLMERQRAARWLSRGYAEVEAILRPAAVEEEAPTQAASVASASVDEPREIQPQTPSGGGAAAAPPGDAPKSIESGEAAPATEAGSAPSAGGTKRIDGARTWSERGPGYQTYHVRY